jgi:hypothetical protein
MAVNHIYTGNLQEILEREEVEGILFSPILITSNNREDLTPENINPGMIGIRYLKEGRTDEVLAVGTFHIIQPPYKLAKFFLDGKSPSDETILYGVIATPLKVNEEAYKRVFGTKKARK